jgi:AraC-like DNA-binding protein
MCHRSARAHRVPRRDWAGAGDAGVSAWYARRGPVLTGPALWHHVVMPLRSNEPTILAVFTLRLIEYGAARGLERDAMLRVIGRPLEALREPGLQIPVQALFDLYAHVMRELDDPAVPLRIADATTMEDLYVMGFAVLTAHDGKEAIQRAVRYGRLITNSSRWEESEHEDRAVIRYHRDVPPGLGSTLGVRAANEGALADFVAGVRQLQGAHITPLRVRFRHRAPRDISAHQAFFRCPVEFDAPHHEFELPISVYRNKFENANTALSAFFVKHAEELLRQHATDDTLQARVRREIADQLPSGELSLARVARRLGMSERSLRRHLTEENASFSQLASEVRYERARALLGSPRLSLGEIAFLLGFSDVSAFSRAFKSWSGMAPGQYRGQGRGAAGDVAG